MFAVISRLEGIKLKQSEKVLSCTGCFKVVLFPNRPNSRVCPSVTQSFSRNQTLIKLGKEYFQRVNGNVKNFSLFAFNPGGNRNILRPGIKFHHQLKLHIQSFTVHKHVVCMSVCQLVYVANEKLLLYVSSHKASSRLKSKLCFVMTL